MAEEPPERRVDEHLRALDEQLAELRRLDALLDERAKRTQAEIRELKRRVAELSAATGPVAEPEDPRDQP
jgi:predicted nuclease with TOPRIM domain